MPAALDDELRSLFLAEPAQVTALAVIDADSAAASSPSSEAAQLLAALRLQTDIGAANTRDMAMVAIQAEAPPDTQAALLERALELLPADVELKFAISNVRKQQFTALNSEPHSRSEAALRRARSQWLTSLRQVAGLDEGRDSSTVHQNLATVQQLMGLYRESAASFVTSLELLGLNVETGQYNRSLAEDERINAKIAMAALDLSRAHFVRTSGSHATPSIGSASRWASGAARTSALRPTDPACLRAHSTSGRHTARWCGPSRHRPRQCVGSSSRCFGVARATARRRRDGTSTTSESRIGHRSGCGGTCSARRHPRRCPTRQGRARRWRVR